MGKKKEKPRLSVNDIGAVRRYAGAYDPNRNEGLQYVASRSYQEVVDLLSEGPIEGITSGAYSFKRNELNLSGWDEVTFGVYTATGVTQSEEQDQLLGFLRSVYWNSIPVVDKDGFYNFPSINVNYVKGDPIGDIPATQSNLPGYGDLSAGEQMDLSITRSIGERLYGPEVKGGDSSPSYTVRAALKSPIDKYAKTYTIYNKECSSLQVNIKVGSLVENIMNSKAPRTYKKSKRLRAGGSAAVGYGDQKARTIDYSIYFQPIFDERFSNNKETNVTKSEFSPYKWQKAADESIEGKIDNPYVRTTNIDVSKAGYMDKVGFEGWRIRIVRITPESLTSFLRNTSFVDSIVEVYGTKLRYPYTSMVYSLFDARSFQRLPSRFYDAKLLKVKVPSNYDPMLKSYGNSLGNGTAITNAQLTSFTASADKPNQHTIKWARASLNPTVYWDGEFKKDSNGKHILEWTDNPAWAFYDLITNPRYGLGEYIDASQVDKWALYEIAQYCDELVEDSYGGFEPRFTINYIITSREEAFKVLNDLASIFRGISYYTQGSIFSTQDKFKSPTYQFNNSNVVDGNFSYASSSKKARHTVAIVRYNDKRDMFQPTIEYVEDEEAVRRYGIREIQTTALGCTSRGQARRFAKWILASESQETETVSFAAGIEGQYLRPGDIIQIYDNNISPLKQSGRTNRVSPLTLTRQNISNAPLPVKTSAAYNNIILDQAIQFEADTVYELSLLTPTYDYRPNTVEDSSELNGIRRSQVQKLLFNGSDTLILSGTDGAWRSDTIITGAPICTQIFFDTGKNADWNSEVTATTAPGTYGGAKNQLDFENYVITGYDNKFVNPSIVGEGTVSAPYSGGYFQGENLIWSVEPYGAAKDDPNLINSHYLNYRIINIKEETNNQHSIAALMYSTGKYSEVDSINSASDVDSASVFFPVDDVYQIDWTTDPVSDWVSTYPRQDYQPDSSTFNGIAIQSNSSLLSVEPDTPYVGLEEAPNMLTLKTTFATASYENTLTAGSTQRNGVRETTQIGFINDAANDGDGYSRFLDQDSITYSVSIITTGDPLITTNWQNSQAFTAAAGVTYLVDPDFYATVQVNEVALITSEETKYFDTNRENIEIETLVNEKVDHYVVIYPLTDAGVVGYGLFRKFDISTVDNLDNYLLSPVAGKRITSLTTEGVSSRPNEDGTFVTEEEEPAFRWNVSDINNIYNTNPDIIYNDGEVSNEKAYELYYLNSNLSYRVTIREKSNSNIPSNKIYYEFYNFASPSTSPSFSFNFVYNTPEIINDLTPEATSPTLIYSGNPNTAVDGIHTEPLSNQVIMDGSNVRLAAGEYQKYEKAGPSNSDTFYKINNSGLVIKDYPNYPLREFDVVVEVQGSDGITSCNNKIFSNTIGDGTSRNITERCDEALLDTNYDIISVSIDSPSGIFFAQAHDREHKNNPFKINYLNEDQAADQNYPYLAECNVYPNGFLYMTLKQVEKDDGELTITDEEFEKFFNNSVGMVYYYTTGDSSVDIIQKEGATVVESLNMAPKFNIDLKHKIGDQYAADMPANIEQLRSQSFDGSQAAVDGYTKAFNGIVSLPEGFKGTVYRDFYLFKENQSLEEFQMPFPKIGRSEVHNINVVFGFFDGLAQKRAFEIEDGETIIYSESNGKKLPKILTDTEINFSRVVTNLENKYSVEAVLLTEETNGVKPFLEAKGTSMFLSEDSVISSRDASLSFQGWAEVTIAATKDEAKYLYYNTEKLDLYQGNGVLSGGKTRKKGWINLDKNTQTLDGDGRALPALPSFSRGNINLADIQVYCRSTLGHNANDRKEFDQTKAGARIIKLEVPFDGTEMDIDKYTVLCDVEVGDKSNFGGSVLVDPDVGLDSSQHVVKKGTKGFVIEITQLARWVKSRKRNSTAYFSPPEIVQKYGGMRINIRVLGVAG